MFDTSYFEQLQDFIASGCSIELTEEELKYYNALYAIVGIQRKYGKDNAIAFLMHEPFNVKRIRASEMYDEAINLFFANDTIENNAHRNMMFDSLMKAAQVVLLTSRNAMDMEVYGKLMANAAKIKQLDRPDPVKRQEVKEKPIKVYELESEVVGIPSVNRQELARLIDGIEDISERERERLKRDARVVDVKFEDMLNDQKEKTKDID